MFERGLLASHSADVPVLSVGNLSVGGTGKTPIVAMLAAELHARGARPVVVMRGYGRDEFDVHRRLNPEVPVVTAADRVRGASEAVRQHAGIVLLDDGFQHRRLRRDVDVVLLAAEGWKRNARLLPAGPWRESIAALERASLVGITRKAADSGAVDATITELQRMIPCLPVVVFSLQPRSLQRLDGSERPLSEIQGRKVLLVTAIADPGSLELQLRREGAVCSTISFRDHHDFGVRDVARLVAASEQTDMVVCTLKDAVKLEEKWPRAAKPLWYVSQVVEVERGHEVLARTLDDIIGINPGFAPLLPRARRAMRINGN